MEEIARRHQHVLVVGSTGLSFEQERDLLRDLVRRQVDGLLVTPTAEDHAELHRELAYRAPMVFIDRAPAGVLTDSVILDNVGGAHQAVSYLLSRGHRRIGYIGGDPAVGTGAGRRAGYRRALEDAGLPYDPALVSLNVHGVAGPGTQQPDCWPDRCPRPRSSPTTTRSASASYRSSTSTGPDRRGGLRRCGACRPAAAPGGDGHLRRRRAGRQAAELLFRRIRGSTEPVAQVLLPTTLELRGGR
ncbi:substrate-binding domain-containing protein [Micromonospora sp. M12]